MVEHIFVMTTIVKRVLTLHTMRISPSSPLYRVPSTLVPKQRLLVEGIRYAINMTFLSWEQLKLILQNIVSKKSMEQEKYAAFLFAWSVIDNLDRLKSLLSHLGAVGFEDL